MKAFFSNEGLTSTSANHIANLSKEHIQMLEMELEELSFVDCSVSIIGSSEQTVIHRGSNKEKLANIQIFIKRICQCKSLIAWLREAIKARDKMMAEVRSMSVSDFAKQNGIEMPTKPVKQSSITADEFIESLGIKDRCTIYDLQTKAAVIGKFIHVNGPLSKARKDLANKLMNTHKVSGDGRDTLVYTYTPTVIPGDVEDLFFNLQKSHREVQAELNGWLHKAECAAANDLQMKSDLYEKELGEYNREMEAIEAQCFSKKQEMMNEIQSLKIVIPNDLREIYEMIKNLGN